MTMKLKELIKNSTQTTVFTGAGVSTECGIPDFRSPGGIWSRLEPIQYDEFMSSEKKRNEDWRRRFLLLEEFKEAKPGMTHKTIAKLMSLSPANRVITQNIDAMHQKAGIAEEQIIELHGSTGHALCQSCGKRYENAFIRKEYDSANGHAPNCHKCGGVIKIAVIHFGQPMPEEPMIESRRACNNSDLFIVAGTSLAVYPAAELPLFAKSKGSVLVLINRDPTPLNNIADLVLYGELSDHLNDELLA